MTNKVRYICSRETDGDEVLSFGGDELVFPWDGEEPGAKEVKLFVDECIDSAEHRGFELGKHMAAGLMFAGCGCTETIHDCHRVRQILALKFEDRKGG